MREWGNMYYSTMTGLLDALENAGYPINKADLTNKENIKSSYNDDGIMLVGASEESLCLTLYCALGIILEKGIKVKPNQFNQRYLDNFPAVEIEIRPNPSHNTIVRGRINNNKQVDELPPNAKTIHNGGKEYLKKNHSYIDYCEISPIVIYCEGRGSQINNTLSTVLYIDSYDRNKLCTVFDDIAKSPLKFFRAIILRGKQL
nr:MAG: hypothetical protein [Metapenaeopsis lamellata majanivirus]